MPQAKKSGTLGVPLMIVAFLAIAGFLYWLSISTEPSEFAMAEEDGSAQLEEATSVTPADFASEGPESFVDQRVRLPNVQVDSVGGLDVFWISLPVQDEEDEVMPYLVRVDREFVEIAVVSNDVVTLTGTVRDMSDDVVEGWDGQGAFPDEGQREAAAAVETFLQADDIERHEAPEDPEAADDTTDPGAGG